MSACVDNHQGTKEFSDTSITTYPKVVQSAEYYKIIEEKPFVYRYTVFNSEGEKVLEDIICDRLPTISMISTDIVDVSVGCGTGIIRHTYYSVSQNRLSEPFEYVVAISNHIVAYIDVSQKSPLEGRKLIIRDIFDRAVYCEEFTFDFSYVDTPVVVAAFDDKGTKLQLTYLAGDEQIETTTLTLNLP